MSTSDHTSDPIGREYSDPGEYVEMLAYAIWVGAKSATTDDPERAWEALSDEERDLFAVVVSAAVSPLMSDLRTAEARATAAEVASRGYRERAEKAEADMRGLHRANLRIRRELAERAEKAEAERDAYKRAKAANDERFMVERDEARAERDALRRAVEHFTAQRAELRGLLAALADRLDDFAHDELSALIEDEPLDHWGERYVSERDALAARIERARALADVLDSEGRETAALGGVYRQGLGDSACDAAARIRAALDGGE